MGEARTGATDADVEAAIRHRWEAEIDKPHCYPPGADYVYPRIVRETNEVAAALIPPSHRIASPALVAAVGRMLAAIDAVNGATLTDVDEAWTAITDADLALVRAWVAGREGTDGR
jgi:hypothetical protein